MKLNLTLLTFLLLAIGNAQAFQKPKGDLADYVNTLQGTNSKFELTRGNTYPTTALPFGMNTWTPQTGINGDGWKYQFFKDSIRGFQQAHQCSSWSNDYAVFSLMPVTGDLKLNDRERASKFSHDNETAKPYFYQVKLGNGVKTEMSPTERGVHLRFSFPRNKVAWVVMDGYTGMSEVKIDRNNRRITGYVRNGRGMQRIEGMKNYFVIQFDKSFRSHGIWENRNNKKWDDKVSKEGEGIGAYLEFKPGQEVQAKVASSYISPEQAQRNLETELGKDENLEKTKSRAKDIWNKHLGKLLWKAERKISSEHFIPVFLGRVFFPESSMKLMKMVNHIITVRMTGKYMRDICIPIQVFGIPSERSFL